MKTNMIEEIEPKTGFAKIGHNIEAEECLATMHQFERDFFISNYANKDIRRDSLKYYARSAAIKWIFDATVNSEYTGNAWLNLLNGTTVWGTLRCPFPIRDIVVCAKRSGDSCILYSMFDQGAMTTIKESNINDAYAKIYDAVKAIRASKEEFGQMDWSECYGH